MPLISNAQFLKGKVLLVKQDFPGAELELNKYQQLGGRTRRPAS